MLKRLDDLFEIYPAGVAPIDYFFDASHRLEWRDGRDAHPRRAMGAHHVRARDVEQRFIRCRHGTPSESAIDWGGEAVSTNMRRDCLSRRRSGCLRAPFGRDSDKFRTPQKRRN